MVAGDAGSAKERSYSDPASASPARFARVAELFEGARQLSGVEREEYLEAEPGEDLELLVEVRKLLALHEAESALLVDENSAVDPVLAAAALAETESRLAERMPDSIGPYRIERGLGRGGMGQVYLARREGADFEKTVAIKVLRPGLEDEGLLRRFRAERRILAQLDHPGIAALHDGGSTEDGRPYVVMEYVEGQDLISHAEAEELDLRDRLELFSKVCEAVAALHRSLIVHRDLKPSNILVARNGAPKLLDFGIAKILEPEAVTGHSIIHTGTGMVLYTPEYASPEQARGDAITTASDVYSLGVLLYELLSGVRPYEFESRRPAEFERVLSEVTPPPVSEAARRAKSGSPASTRLARKLTGDLDTICAMALRKEPERRYATVNDLAEDIRCHLVGLPVLARKDTLRYRTTKFLRRRFWWVASAALFVFLLCAFAVAMALQAQRIAHQRDVAELESEISSQVSDFLVGLFEVADPTENAGEQITARDLLDRGASEIRHELKSGPLVRAALLDSMGWAYRGLGEYERAASLLEESLRLLDEDARGAPARGPSRARLAIVQHLAGDREYQEVEAALREALAEVRSHHPETSEEVALVQRSLASYLSDVGRMDEALGLARAAHRTQLALHGSPHRATALSLMDVATILERRSEFEEAERMLLEVRAMQALVFGADHTDLAETALALAVVYRSLGRLDAALAETEESLRIHEAILGPDHPDVDGDRFSMGAILLDAGELERAEEVHRQLLERDRERFGKHVYVSLDLNNLAGVLSRRGDQEGAWELHVEALALQREILPVDHPEIATTLSNMGVVLRRQDRLDEAEPYFQEALAVRERCFPADHPAVLTSRNLLAILKSDRGEHGEALELSLEILRARREKLGEHSMVAGSLYGCAVYQHRLGDAEGAEERTRESIAMYRATLPPGHLDLARPLHFLGTLLRNGGRPLEAEAVLTEALGIRAGQLEPEHPDLAGTRRELALCRSGAPPGADGAVSDDPR